MSQAVSKYHALYESLLSRRSKPVLPTGLDRVYGRLAMKLRNRKVSLEYLRAEAEASDRIHATEIRELSEQSLADQIATVRAAFVRGRQDQTALRRALALVREVARRETGEDPYIVQQMGALALFHGRIIEMLTGEGKTLTGSLAAPLIAWHRRYLHVFTVNDYLAKRDAESRARMFKRCMCETGSIQQEQEPGERFGIYARHIVYGTPKQITADYLRDQIRLGRMSTAWAGRTMMAQMSHMPGESGMGPMIPGLKACMVDEADAVLIDEGVVPLIIARPRREDDMSKVYVKAAAIAIKLDEGPDFEVEHVKRRVELKRRGLERLDNLFEQVPDPLWKARRRAEELVRQALVAQHCYIRGKQYEVVEDRIVIVDEYTGRFLPDRSWEHGLHQAVEAKEGAQVTADRETLARLSFQRFYRTYPFMCGMTGTAADATKEMEAVYARPVTKIPTHRPVIRAQWPTRVFRTAKGKWDAIIASIEEIHAAGRPVLVGTRSVAASEFLSAKLKERNLEHFLLNAHHDKDEATLIAQAGRTDLATGAAITVATNMAGRGTDIKPDEDAIKAGGLHVLLTEMHGAKRVDRQFIGRAGRQGDPGSAQIFVSVEDELVVRHAPRLRAWLEQFSKLKGGDHAALERAVTRSGGWDELDDTWSSRAERIFKLAQSRSEAHDRRSRESVLRQDDWVDKYMPGM